MLRVLRSLIGIQEKKELPKRSPALLHLRLATASSEAQTKTLMNAQPEKSSMLMERKELETKLTHTPPKADERIFSATKISSRMPSDASVQADLNVAAIGSFWEKPRYSKPQQKSNNHPSHTDDDNPFFLTSSYQR